MITDRDVAKLKKVFLTKQDARDFLTKEDARGLLTKQDAKKFLTKEDGKKFLTKEDGKKFASALDMEIVKQKLTALEGNSARFESLAERMVKAADRMAGRVETLETEAKIGANVAARHTRQIGALAVHAGVTLPE